MPLGLRLDFERQKAAANLQKHGVSFAGSPKLRRTALILASVAALSLTFPPGTIAQTSPAPATQPNPNAEWETAAGGHLEFDVISIHPEKDPGAPSSMNVPNGPDDTYTDTGGFFRATNWPVGALIGFAFKNTTAQRDVFRASLPDWAQNKGFDIEARTDNPHVTKDQMRLMVRSMLIQRFGLKVHYETRDVSVYAVELIKPGVLGPGLRPHPNDDSCSGAAATTRARASGGRWNEPAISARRPSTAAIHDARRRVPPPLRNLRKHAALAALHAP